MFMAKTPLMDKTFELKRWK